MSETTTKADIVVGVDGSDESFAALKWALKGGLTDRTACQCRVRLDPFVGYGFRTGQR